MRLREKWDRVFKRYHIPLSGGQTIYWINRYRSLITITGCGEYVALHRIIAQMSNQFELSDDAKFDLYATIDEIKLESGYRRQARDIIKDELIEEEEPYCEDYDQDKIWRYF